MRLGNRLRRRWLRYKYRYLSDEQLRPGHLYKDELSGLYLTLTSVGTQVTFEYGDEAYSLPKKEAQFALDAGFLTHAERRCTSCPQ